MWLGGHHWVSPHRMMRELNSKAGYVLVKTLGEEELRLVKSLLAPLPSSPGLHHLQWSSHLVGRSHTILSQRRISPFQTLWTALVYTHSILSRYSKNKTQSLLRSKDWAMNLLEKMQELAMENHKITYSSGLIGEDTYEKYIWSHITLIILSGKKHLVTLTSQHFFFFIATATVRLLLDHIQ